jgi:hypothetical protein
MLPGPLPAENKKIRRTTGEADTMNAKFVHPSGQGRTAHGDIPESATPKPWLADRACCCPAWPAVRVIMPAIASRPQEADLLLCAHHYRVSRQALDAAGAVVIELPGRDEEAEALLRRIPAPAPALG